MDRSIFLQAPAKLNLALSVGAPNEQAMHPISSWMVTVDLFDDLHLDRLPAEHHSLFATIWHADALRRSEIDWAQSKDLVFRAHAKLEAHVGRQLPVKSRLEKRIPVGGGLGGGSSNAAAMLRGLNQLFDLRLAPSELGSICASLGSDVSFLLEGGSALVSGLGELIEPLGAPPKIHPVLFFPQVACPTGEVYRAFDRLSSDALVQEERVRALSARELIGPLDPFNDLASAALDVAPSIADDMEEIAQLCELPVHVCGSGSSLFAIASDEMHAAALADICTRRLDIPAVAATTTVTPAPR